MVSPKCDGDFSKTVFKLIDFASTDFEEAILVETKKVKTGETQMFSESNNVCTSQANIRKVPLRYAGLIR